MLRIQSLSTIPGAGRIRPSQGLAVSFLALALRTGSAFAASLSFNRDVRPILSENCFYCHGPDSSQRKGKLRLDTVAGQQKEGVIVPGKPDDSELVARIYSDDDEDRMPPSSSHKTLTDAQRQTLRRWIMEGARFEQHWALIPPVRPALPVLKSGIAPANPIDAFVRAKLEEKNLAPARPAPAELQLRRLSLDLTGLPPTEAELDEFLGDHRPGAYERQVDRLLASPRYGENMAMGWLDVARYADTNGFQSDAYRMNWPWRDWVVRAFNANMPYDQFTIEQLAGDLLPNPTRDQLVATAFNRNHMLNAEGGSIPEENRTKNVFDRVETTSRAWLGLTLQCAQCHDHKFDPLTQKDYYAMFAVFNKVGESGGVETRFGKKPQGERYDKLYMIEAPFVQLDTPETKKALDQAASARKAAEATFMASRPEFHPQFLAWVGEMRANPLLIEKRLEGEFNRRAVSSAKLEDYHDSNTIALLDAFLALPGNARWAHLKEAADQARFVEEDAMSVIPHVMVMRDDSPRKSFVLLRGNYETPGEEVKPALPAVLQTAPAGAPVDRLTLARWLVAPQNPLTARVTVNRFWQQIFGRGLVKTADDFGLRGDLPSNPELLDWLAVEFRESGWDVKHLLRLIVTSDTYRQSAAVTPELRELDPENALLARGPRFRLDSRTLRDQALFISGLLVEKQGGPSVAPYQPPGIWEDMSFGKNHYVQSKGDDLYRRSLYTVWRRSVGPADFFDVPSRQVCTVNLVRTSTPLHALTTLNDPTYVEAARVWAGRLSAFRGDAVRLRKAFRQAVSRTPDKAEIAQLRNTLNHLRTHFAEHPNDARKLIAVGDTPTSANLDPNEYASWTSICLLILNLDETLSKS